MEKSDINLNEYNNYDRVDIYWNNEEEHHYDDIAEFSWNQSKDIVELINSVGAIIYINMYSVSLMQRYLCGGIPYTIN